MGFYGYDPGQFAAQKVGIMQRTAQNVRQGVSSLGSQIGKVVGSGIERENEYTKATEARSVLTNLLRVAGESDPAAAKNIRQMGVSSVEDLLPPPPKKGDDLATYLKKVEDGINSLASSLASNPKITPKQLDAAMRLPGWTDWARKQLQEARGKAGTRQAVSQAMGPQQPIEGRSQIPGAAAAGGEPTPAQQMGIQTPPMQSQITPEPATTQAGVAARAEGVPPSQLAQDPRYAAMEPKATPAPDPEIKLLEDTKARGGLQSITGANFYIYSKKDQVATTKKQAGDVDKMLKLMAGEPDEKANIKIQQMSQETGLPPNKERLVEMKSELEQDVLRKESEVKAAEEQKKLAVQKAAGEKKPTPKAPSLPDVAEARLSVVVNRALANRFPDDVTLNDFDQVQIKPNTNAHKITTNEEYWNAFQWLAAKNNARRAGLPRPSEEATKAVLQIIAERRTGGGGGGDGGGLSKYLR